jgi:hypothetical protein
MKPLDECIRSLALAASFEYAHGLHFMEQSIDQFIKSAGRDNESRLAALDELAQAVKSKGSCAIRGASFGLHRAAAAWLRY